MHNFALANIKQHLLFLRPSNQSMQLLQFYYIGFSADTVKYLCVICKLQNPAFNSKIQVDSENKK